MEKNFENGSSGNITFSKPQSSKMIQSGGLNFLDLVNPVDAVCKSANKAKESSNKALLYELIKTAGSINSKHLLIANLLFQNKVKKYKMNAIVNKVLLAGDKFMSEMYLRQPGFTYSAFRPFPKNKENIKNLKKQEIQDIFIKTN